MVSQKQLAKRVNSNIMFELNIQGHGPYLNEFQKNVNKCCYVELINSHSFASKYYVLECPYFDLNSVLVNISLLLFKTS